MAQRNEEIDYDTGRKNKTGTNQAKEKKTQD